MISMTSGILLVAADFGLRRSNSRVKRLALGTALTVCALLAKADPLRVFACEPEWAALAFALGGDQLDIYSATTAMQDPHHIQARPSLIARVRSADLLVCTGAELEVGWLPVLLRKSGNPAIQPGQLGHFMATDQVELLDKRTEVDRSEGDVHAGGNPHIHLDPARMLTVAKKLEALLAQLRPEQSALFARKLATFEQNLSAALAAREGQLAVLRGRQFVVHHNSWRYAFDWLGIEQVGELEPKPGLPPTSSHLAALLDQLRARPADGIVYAAYQDDKPARWLSQRSGIPAIALPYTVQDWQRIDALPLFYQQLLTVLSGAMSATATPHNAETVAGAPA